MRLRILACSRLPGYRGNTNGDNVTSGRSIKPLKWKLLAVLLQILRKVERVSLKRIKQPQKQHKHGIPRNSSLLILLAPMFLTSLNDIGRET